jgi:hypothetical protein
VNVTGSRRQGGSALLLAIFLIAVLGAGTAALAPLAAIERLLVTAGREAAACRYAAAAVAAYAAGGLQRRADWTGVLAGDDVVALGAGNRRPVIGGSRLEDLDAIGRRLPGMERGNWGPDAPVWSLFAWGFARDLAPDALVTGIHVAAWVADDERDGDRDSGRDTNGTLHIAAQAFGGIRGTCRVMLTVRRERPWPAALRLLDWREGG